MGIERSMSLEKAVVHERYEKHEKNQMLSAFWRSPDGDEWVFRRHLLFLFVFFVDKRGFFRRRQLDVLFREIGSRRNARELCGAEGYGVLTTIAPGDGYWVNVAGSAGEVLPTQSGEAFDFGVGKLASGWNLVATGNDLGPAEFNRSLSTALAGTVNLTTLWRWDNANNKWMFYAPHLAGLGTLTSYIAGKDYAELAGATLGDVAIAFFSR